MKPVDQINTKQALVTACSKRKQILLFTIARFEYSLDQVVKIRRPVKEYRRIGCLKYVLKYMFCSIATPNMSYYLSRD